MGAWGYNSFENDAACDWAFKLEEANDLQFIEETLDAVFGEEYLEVDEATRFQLEKQIEQAEEERTEKPRPKGRGF